MTTYHFTPIVVGASNHPDSVNDPMGQLDSAIGQLANSGVNGATASAQLKTLKALVDAMVIADGTANAEVTAARTAINTTGNAAGLLDSLSDAMVFAAGNVHSVQAYGAIGDGSGDTIAEWVTGGTYDRGYADLTAIQVDYPHATALTDTIDWVAARAAINALGNARGIVLFPTAADAYVMNQMLDVKRAWLWGNGPPGNSGGGGSLLEFSSTFGIYSSVEDNFGYGIFNLGIDGSNASSPTQSGQILVDFSGQNCPRLKDVRIRYGDIGIKCDKGSTVECNYGRFENVFVFLCYWGYYFKGGASNSHTLVGGRLWSNRTSIKIGTAHTATDIDGNGATATVTTSAAHGLAVNDPIVIVGSTSFDNDELGSGPTYSVASVPTTTSFTFAHASSNTNETGTVLERPNNINLHGVAFESSSIYNNEYGIDYYGSWCAVFGCRFESSGIGQLANINLRAGCGPLGRFGNFFSTGVDILDANNPPRHYGMDAIANTQNQSTILNWVDLYNHLHVRDGRIKIYDSQSAFNAGTPGSIYMTDGTGGSYPFNETSNLVIEGRNTSRDVVIVTGATPAVSVIVDNNHNTFIETGNLVVSNGDGIISQGDLRITTATTPASAAATGTVGTIAWDTSYLYVCTASNQWRRVAHATW